MDRSFQFNLRQLFATTTVIAVFAAVATDMAQRVASEQANTFVFALEGNALGATIVILLELAWFRHND
jgi:hypothetical protein